MASTHVRETVSQAMLEEKKKLRKEFKLFDMVFVTFTAIVGIDTLGVVSSKGPSVISWLIISAITFFIPYGLLTAEIGSTFSQEGGVYEWCKLAGGRLFASFAAILYWISNPLWVGGTLAVTAIAAIKTFWFGDPNVLLGGGKVSDAILEMVIALVFIWGTTWCAILSLRVGKWLSVLGSYIKMGLFVVLAILVLVFFFGGHAKGDHYGFADILPTGDVGLIFSAILPALIFNWAGFELQNGAGEEMVNAKRDVPLSLLRSGLFAVIAYAIPILAIFVALTKDQLNSASGFLTSFQVVAGVLPSGIGTVLGWLIALGFIIALASSGGTWIIGADRTYAISALDRTAPARLGRFSGKYGTPIAVNTLSGIIATVAMAAAILVNSFGSGTISSLFGIVMGFVISTTTLSYMLIFPAYFILRVKYPHIHRPYQVPGGLIGAGIVTAITFFYAAIASYFILWPADANIPSGISRFTYELAQFVPLLIIVALNLIFYVWGQRERRNRDVEVELNLAEGAFEVSEMESNVTVVGD